MSNKQLGAEIIAFPAHKARPGLRQTLTATKAEILHARETGIWAPGESQITPNFVSNLIPPPDAMYDLNDSAVAEIALQVSLLSLHSIQGGDWNDVDKLSYFLDLQVASQLLEESRAQAIATG